MSLSVSVLAGLQTSKYFNVAGMAILIFSHATTLDEEVRWIWGRDWDATRVFFMISRYIPFAGLCTTAYSALRSNSDPCGPPVLGNVFHILGIIASEVLLVLRTYAFWQSDKRVLYGLVGYGCVSIVAAGVISVLPLSLAFEKEALDGNCLFATSRNGTFVYSILLVFELLVLFLTLYKRVRSYRGMGTSGIVYTLYRDGMFYILSILLVTFANVLLDAVFPLQYSDLLELPQIVLHSVLASRIMFNIRKSYNRVQPGPGATNSSIQMLSDIVCQPGPNPVPRDTESGAEPQV